MGPGFCATARRSLRAARSTDWSFRPSIPTNCGRWPGGGCGCWTKAASQSRNKHSANQDARWLARKRSLGNDGLWPRRANELRRFVAVNLSLAGATARPGKISERAVKDGNGRQRESMNGRSDVRDVRCRFTNVRWPLGERWKVTAKVRIRAPRFEAAAKISRADGETAPEEAPFPIEESITVEESPRHPKLITLTAIHRHPLPRH